MSMAAQTQTAVDYRRMPDAELARLCAARDRHAIEHVITANNQRLFRTAWSILKHRAEAEEAVQAAYLSAFSSIGGLSKAVGSQGFGTDYRSRTGSGELDGQYLPIDFAALCEGLGAKTVRATTHDEFAKAVESMPGADRTTAVVAEVDKELRVPGYESWWDVPISEVSEIATIREARARYEVGVKKERRLEISEPKEWSRKV